MTIHTVPSSPWFAFPKPNDNASLRLFCFPYAGAGPLVYRTWPEGLPEQVEVVSVHYPGRESRFRETPFSSLELLVSAIADAILPLLDRPYAFWGHSLGGLVAFELTRTLRARGIVLPVHLFISSRRAAQIPEPNSPIHMLDDENFARRIQQRYNGIPAIIQQDPELMAMFLPVLRADFSLIETYHYCPEPAFDFPFSGYMGQTDPGLSTAELIAWQEHTSRPISIKTFPGDHFFLQSQRVSLLETISGELLRYLS